MAGKIKNILNKRAVILAALFLVSGSYLGVRLWNYQEKSPTVAKAAFEPEQVFAEVTANRKWVLLGDEFTSKQKSLTFSVELSPEFSISDVSLSYQINAAGAEGKMLPEGDARFSAEIFVGNLKPGRHTVKARADSSTGSATSPEVEFIVSYPLYVTWTLDWEGYDIPQNYLGDLTEISQKYGVPITHFFNPRLYTSPDISGARAEYLTEWVRDRRDQNGDAIGLHLHMFPDMVKAAGVAPRSKPAWGSNLKDGYDILTSAYTQEETAKMLDWSKRIFEENGLGTPTMFRAGGWFADEETLMALQDTGFNLDSSGRTGDQEKTTNIEGHWDLSAATHPYQLNAEDQNLIGSPTTNLWEFPNNGADSWAYTQKELYQRFTANFNGDPLNEKQVVTYLSHPEWFSTDKPKIEALFSAINKYRNSADRGPVIYITLDQAYQIWAGR